MDPQGPVKFQLCPPFASICAVSLVPHPLNLALNPPTNTRLKFDSVIILLDVLVTPCRAIYCVRLILHHRSAVPSYVVPYYCSIMYTIAPWYRTTIKPNHRTTIPPYHRTTANSDRTTVPLDRTTVPYHRTTVPYLISVV